MSEHTYPGQRGLGSTFTLTDDGETVIPEGGVVTYVQPDYLEIVCPYCWCKWFTTTDTRPYIRGPMRLCRGCGCRYREASGTVVKFIKAGYPNHG